MDDDIIELFPTRTFPTTVIVQVDVHIPSIDPDKTLQERLVSANRTDTIRVYVQPESFFGGIRARKELNMTESQAVMYCFNSWPNLRLQLSVKISRIDPPPEQLRLYVFENEHHREPCAILINVTQPLAKPTWDLWLPYTNANITKDLKNEYQRE